MPLGNTVKQRRLLLLLGVALVVLFAADAAQARGCLTRTPGFWGNHPLILDDFLDPDIEVCGVDLTTISAGSCTSLTEALCVAPGKESKGNPSKAQLIRQIAAAKLNFQITWDNGGGCGEEARLRVEECEALCASDPTAAEIRESECIEDLDAFNRTLDTFELPTPPPLDSPGPANSSFCRAARGNGIVIAGGQCSQ